MGGQHTMIEPFPNAGTATHEVKLRALEYAISCEACIRHAEPDSI
jgi:hypothetical protein